MCNCLPGWFPRSQFLADPDGVGGSDFDVGDQPDVFLQDTRDM